LADRAGLRMPEPTTGNNVVSEDRDVYYRMNVDAAKYFHRTLLSDEGKVGLDYFKKRQLSMETIVKYGLGFAPDGWNGLRDELLKKGYTEEQIIKNGLASKSERGSVYDKFRNRAMFPIFDVRGRVIAFGGRVLDDSKPKYLNSPDTPVFNKSKHLFSLNFAKTVQSKRLVLVEGYMDVIGLANHGVPFAIASLGTALTSDQARLLAKYCQEVVVCYDTDNAGRMATLRALEVLRPFCEKVRVVSVDKGKDPDEYVRERGAEAFLNLLDEAVDQTAYQINLAREKVDLDNLDEKVSFLNETADILVKIDNAVKREAYLQKVANETGMNVEALRAELAKRDRRVQQMADRSQERKRDNSSVSPAGSTLQRKAERLLIGLCCQDAAVMKWLISRQETDCFEDDIAKKLAQRLFDEKIVDPPLLLEGFEDKEREIASGILCYQAGYENHIVAAEQLLSTIKKAKLEHEINDMAAGGNLAELKALIEKRRKNGGASADTNEREEN
ncbi:MAG: DNA primase, partial [Clostridia bacterium]|nr:DNA primase [Clostridia bacterium]